MRLAARGLGLRHPQRKFPRCRCRPPAATRICSPPFGPRSLAPARPPPPSAKISTCRCRPPAPTRPGRIPTRFARRAPAPRLASLQHRPHDALECEENQNDREQHDGELEHLPDETQIATVASEEVEERGDGDRGEREKEQQANKDQGASDSCRAATRAAPAPREPGAQPPAHHAGESCQPWNAEGTSAGSAKVTISNAAVRARSARATALLRPWPDLKAVYCPISGCPSR